MSYHCKGIISVMVVLMPGASEATYHQCDGCRGFSSNFIFFIFHWNFLLMMLEHPEAWAKFLHSSRRTRFLADLIMYNRVLLKLETVITYFL